jgi:hypothetical protein
MLISLGVDGGVVDEGAGEEGLAGLIVKVCDAEPIADHRGPITAGDVDDDTRLAHVLSDLMLEREIVHVAALQRMNAVVDADVVVEVESLLRGVGAGKPGALHSDRLGGALAEEIPDVADDEEREGDERSPDEKIHVCCPWCGGGLKVAVEIEGCICLEACEAIGGASKLSGCSDRGVSALEDAAESCRCDPCLLCQVKETIAMLAEVALEAISESHV